MQTRLGAPHTHTVSDPSVWMSHPTQGWAGLLFQHPKAEAVAMCWFGFLAANTAGLELTGAHQTFIKNKAAVYINSKYTNLKSKL